MLQLQTEGSWRFFLLTQEFICISMCNTFSLKWGSQKSHLWVFITCQRNVSRHWRSYRMKSCLLQTTNWGEERRELHCKTLPIHISYSVLIIILLAYKKIQNTPSIIQHEWRWCATLNSKAIIDFLSFLKDSFLTLRMALCQNLFFFLSCPGAIKRMQNGLFSMHSKMPCCIIIFGKKSSIWIEGLL